MFAELLEIFVNSLNASHGYQTNLDYSNHQHYVFPACGTGNKQEVSLSDFAICDETRVIIITVLEGDILVQFDKSVKGKKPIIPPQCHFAKEAIYLRCPNDKSLRGKCGDKHPKCPYHNKSIKISSSPSSSGTKASFVVLAYKLSDLEVFLSLSSRGDPKAGYDVFYKNTAVKFEEKYFKPQENAADGTCALLSVLDHLTWLHDSSNQVCPSHIASFLHPSTGNGEDKSAGQVKLFIKGLKSFMTNEEHLDLLICALMGTPIKEMLDRVRTSRRNRGFTSTKDAYAGAIKIAAEGLDTIKSNVPDSWPDDFIIWCMSFWLKLPILVVSYCSKNDKLVSRLHTSTATAPGWCPAVPDWRLDPPLCEMSFR